MIAKPRYWGAWLALADRFFDFVESGASPELAALTTYESGPTPMKAFVQERFPALILSQDNFKTFALELSQQPLHDDPETRRALIACDVLKERYCATGDSDYLALYRKIRSQIEPQ